MYMYIYIYIYIEDNESLLLYCNYAILIQSVI